MKPVHVHGPGLCPHCAEPVDVVDAVRAYTFLTEGRALAMLRRGTACGMGICPERAASVVIGEDVRSPGDSLTVFQCAGHAAACDWEMSE